METRVTRLPIDFSQRIQLAWLDWTVQMVLAGSSKEQLRAELQLRLSDKLSIDSAEATDSRADGTNRAKAVRMLIKTWYTAPAGLASFRDEGLGLLAALPTSARLAVHWGMLLVVFPFFAAIAEAAGRLDRLQGTVNTSQIQRRIKEQFGERESVSRAARRALRSLVDWEVLAETQSKGVYEARPPRALEDERLAAWLVESAYWASGVQSLELYALTQSPMLFPFQIPVSVSITTPRLDVLRLGVANTVLTSAASTKGC